MSDAVPESAALSDAHLRMSAALAKGLADENRLRILCCISTGKKSVGNIVDAVKLSQPLVSHHLRELKRCLLVRVERSGPFVYYETANSDVLELVRMLADVASDLLAQRNTL